MKPVIVHPRARAEWDSGMGFYEARVPGLGLDFHRQVERAIQKIRQHPQRWPLHSDARFRRYVLKRFPYSIFYMERANDIWIVAVAHAKRRPDYWTRRQGGR